MADFGSALWNKPAAADSTPADPVTRSLRFDEGTPTLSRTPTSSGSQRKFTLSMWIKRTRLDSTGYETIWGSEVSGANYCIITFYEDCLQFQSHVSGYTYTLKSNAKYRDVSAFYHITLSVDTDQELEANRIKIYVNGEEVTFSSSSYPTRYYDLQVNTSTYPVTFGYSGGTAAYFAGYVADVYFIDGEAKLPTDFIETTGYGSYKPKAYTGEFGTNGFHIDAQPAHDAELLVSSIDRNDGDTLFADAAKGHTITKGGDPEHSIAVGNPFTGDGRAIYFDGSGDYLTSTDAKDDANFDNSNWTLEFWANPSTTFGSVRELFMGCGGGVQGWNSTDGHNWNMFAYGDDNEIWVQYWDGSSYTTIKVDDDLIPANTWTHVALVQQSGTVRWYIGGVQRATSTTSFAAISTPSSFRIGDSAALDGGTSNWSLTQFEGYIYDVSIQRGYCKYEDGTTFTPPTSKITAESNTKFLLQPEKDDPSFEDESSNGHTISATGSPTITASTPYDAAAKSTAMYFDGNDNITTSTSTDLAISSGDSFTAECWVYFNSTYTAANDGIFSTYGVGDTAGWAIELAGGSWGVYDSGGGRQTSSTTATTGEWHHVALVKTDNTADGARLYLNGNKIDDVTVSSNITSARSITLGNYYAANSTYDIDGYIFDARFTKGEEKYTGSTYTVPSAPFELNPVYIGGDQSGNKNHFAPTNISGHHDVMLDVPTKNYATWNPLTESGATYSEGNTKINCNFDGGNGRRATMEVSSGKWYWEVLRLDAYGNVGVFDCSNNTVAYYAGYSSSDYGMSMMTLGFNRNGSQTSTSNTTTTNDIVQFALDVDAGKLWIGKNGTWFESGDPSAGTNAIYDSDISGRTWSPTVGQNYSATSNFVLNAGADPTFAGNKPSGQDTSQSEFYYAPPTDSDGNPFKSLNTSNLDAPAVKPAEHFGMLTYNGNSDLSNASGSTQNVTGVNFDVGMAWIKDRDNNSSGYTSSGSDEYGHYLFDTVTGASSGGYNLDGDVVSSGSGTTLNSGYYGVTSFSAGSGTNRGITVDEAGETNFDYDDGFYQLTERYVAWLWKLGSTGSSSTWNSSYTAPSTEHYNDSAGVTTIEVSPASSGNLEVAHSLSAAPEFFFVGHDSYPNFTGYPAFHKDLDSGKYLQLDDNSAQSSDSTYFPSGAAHADYIKLGSVFADSYGYGGNLRIWAFTSVEGYSKFGRFTGNYDANGPMVYTGFRPRYLLIKNTTSSNQYNWFLVDSAREPNNDMADYLFPNTSDDEDTAASNKVDFLSNGFKMRGAGNVTNQNNGTMVYIAFAESPFKYANAK